jgi:PIN domain nuclease of toxin-antitoxin system
MIIAQAQVEEITIVGKDQAFDPYDVEMLW